MDHLAPIIAFVAALVLASVDWWAVARGRRRMEYILKPATMMAVLIAAGLLMQGLHDVWQARFLLPGLACCLVGDVFLMLPSERFFLPGLVSFFVGHLCYIVSLNPTWPPCPAFVILVGVVVIDGVLFRAISARLRRRGMTSLLVPVVLYGVVLSLMLFSAWAVLFRPEWTPLRRGLVIIGASLFFASDVVLGWDRFVDTSHTSRLWIMIPYHLGQMSLAASIAFWQC